MRELTPEELKDVSGGIFGPVKHVISEALKPGWLPIQVIVDLPKLIGFGK
jgi:hypothetical protein